MTPTEAFRHSVARTYMEIGSHALGAKVCREWGYWSCTSRIDHPVGNFALRFESEVVPNKPVRMALCRPSYRIFTVTGDKPTDLGDRLADMGLTHRYDLEGLRVDNPPNETCPEVVPAESREEAREVARFIVSTFFWRSPRPQREELARIFSAAHPRHEFLYLRDDFGIVAAGTLTLDVEVIGLYNLCVRSDARSRGIGSAFFADLVRRAASRAPHVSLMCDSGLVPWYSRRGCTVVGKLQAFSA